MKQLNYDRGSRLATQPAPAAEFSALLKKYGRRTFETPGLSAHVRQLRNRRQGFSRWVVLAIFAGVVVALAMVQFAIH